MTITRPPAALQLMRDAHEAHIAALYRALPRLTPDATAHRIERIAFYATDQFCGLLQDYRLEAPLLQLGEKLITPTPHVRKPNHVQRILHVATQVFPTGGHTRVISQWMHTDAAHTHTLYLTDQTPQDTANIDFLQDLTLYHSRQHTPISKAQELRTMADGFDLVILHTHMYDPVPLLAFAAPGPIPVFLYNHADHVFWLGASIADCVVDIRDLQLPQRYRNCPRTYYLPFMAPKPCHTPKAEAKARVHISPHSTVLLSMASASKFLPEADNPIATTIIPLLRHNPDLTYILIGPDADFVIQNLCPNPPTNLIATGVLPHPDPYLQACDIYIESLPIGSGLSNIDTLRYGAAPLWNTPYSHEIAHMGGMSYFYGNEIKKLAPTTKEEWAKLLQRLIEDPQLRQQYAHSATESLLNMQQTSFLSHLERLYTMSTALPHTPQLTPELHPLSGVDDIILYTIHNDDPGRRLYLSILTPRETLHLMHLYRKAFNLHHHTKTYLSIPLIQMRNRLRHNP